MKRQHRIRGSEKAAMHLMYFGSRGMVMEEVDAQVMCVWFL